MYVYSRSVADYFYEKYYKPSETVSVPEASATVFKHYVEEIPIYVQPDDYIAGFYGYQNSVPFEVKQKADEWEKKQKEKAQREIAQNGPDPYVMMDNLYLTHGAIYDRGHHMLDYEALLSKGIKWYIAAVEERLARTDKEEERQYLKGMLIALNATQSFALRFSQCAEKMAQGTSDKKKKDRLQTMADNLKRVPLEPSRNYLEALQAISILWSCNAISEHAWVSISLGSFDQFMLPYYQASRDEGVSDKEIQKQTENLFRIFSAYNGNDGVLSIGGQDEQGRDLCNPLSKLLIETFKDSNLPAPLFVFRVNKNTPDDLLQSTINSKLFEKGQPTYYSEEECLRAVRHRGIEDKYARRYAMNNCMGLFIPGEEVASSWGCVMNMHLPLELALNYGSPLSGVLPLSLKTEPILDFDNIDQLYDQYQKYLTEIFDICIDFNRKKIDEGVHTDPNPWVSALTPSCIERARDRWDGGARFQTITVECFCFGMTGDAFTAIEELIFKQKKYTVDDLLAAAQNNYVGYEEIRNDILSCPKYGMGDPVADGHTKRVLTIMADLCDSRQNENWYYLPSLHTLTFEVPLGKKYYATLDGRRKGEPLNKNAGPTNVVRSLGPTVTALSAAGLDQYRLSGGQALDLHFNARDLGNTAKRKKIDALITTYLSTGGLQLNVNALDSKTLKKACENPEKYKDLIVRIGGHSRYFNDLSLDVRKEFAERYAIEEGASL